MNKLLRYPFLLLIFSLISVSIHVEAPNIWIVIETIHALMRMPTIVNM